MKLVSPDVRTCARADRRREKPIAGVGRRQLARRMI